MSTKKCRNCEEGQGNSAYYSLDYPCKMAKPCGERCPQVDDSSCIVYTGPELDCSAAGTNICLEALLQQFDQKICAIVGNYEGYDVGCLSPVTTEKDFVEKIAAFVCETRTALNSFISTTFPQKVDDLQAQIDTLSWPAVSSCIQVGISATDSSKQVLQKLAGSLCNVYTQIDLTDANWSSCFSVVGTPPKTPLEATNALLAQICAVKEQNTQNNIVTFDNTNGCLVGGTANDGLLATIGLIKNRLCQSPVLDTNELSYGCTGKPPAGAQDLQGTLENILKQVDSLFRHQYTFDQGQFTETFIDPAKPCLGKQITLNDSVGSSDRRVAATAEDTQPGPLVSKLEPGVGITLDFISKPGVGIINATIPPLAQHDKVKTTDADPKADYLGAKIKATGDTDNGLALSFTVDTDYKAHLAGSLDVEKLAESLIKAISENPALKEIFCALVNSCPAACSAPTNASVTFTT